MTGAPRRRRVRADDARVRAHRHPRRDVRPHPRGPPRRGRRGPSGARARPRAASSRRTSRRTGRREPRASAFHRFAMVSLAVALAPRSSRRRTSSCGGRAPSFTADTLRRLARRGLRTVAAFLHHRHRRVCGNCHLARLPGRARPRALRRHRAGRASRSTRCATGCRDSRRGCGAAGDGRAGRRRRTTCAIFLVNAATPDVSSTADPRAGGPRRAARRAGGARGRAPHRQARAVRLVTSRIQEAVLHETLLTPGRGRVEEGRASRTPVARAVAGRARQEGARPSRPRPAARSTLHRLLRHLLRAERPPGAGDCRRRRGRRCGRSR